MIQRWRKSKETKNNRKGMKRILISTTLVGSLVISGNIVGASNSNLEEEITVNIQSSSVEYNDFDSKAYWANDMLWAIDKGLINGYINSKHPTNKNIKTIGNWLNPYAPLTEAQMTAVLFRYTKPTELKNTKPQSTWWASTAYQLASKYKLPVKGSISKKAVAEKVVTRGMLAQSLATIHFGKSVTMQQAVQFMYDSDVSTGRSASLGKTYANFGVNDQLQRAHIAAFMKRYDTFLASGKQVQLGGSGQQTQPTQPTQPTVSLAEMKMAPKGHNVINGKTVYYGNHTYGTASQSEYNQVMQFIENKIKNQDFSVFNLEPEHIEYIQAKGNVYINNDRSDFDSRSDRNNNLRAAKSMFDELIQAGVSQQQIEHIYKAMSFNMALQSEIADGTNIKDSAYTALIGGVLDSGGSAYVTSAVLDAFGYNTLLIYDDGHADPLVEINDQWYSPISLTFFKVDVQGFLNQGGSIFSTQTYGSHGWK